MVSVSSFLAVVALVAVLVVVPHVHAVSVTLNPGQFTVHGAFQGLGVRSTCAGNCPYNSEFVRQIRWGVPIESGCGGCGRPDLQPSVQSGFGWRQTRNDIPANNQWHQVAEFAHINNPIKIPGCNVENHFQMALSGSLGDLAVPSSTFSFSHIETCSVAHDKTCQGIGTSLRDCWCPGDTCDCISCPDRVFYSGGTTKWSKEPARINGIMYTGAYMDISQSTFWTNEVSVNRQPIRMKIGPTKCPATCTGPAPNLCRKKVCDHYNGVCKEDVIWNDDSRCGPGPAPAICHWKDCVGGACKTDLPFPNPQGDSRCPAKPTAYCQRQACVGTACKNNIIWNEDTRCATEYLPTVNGKKVRRECYDGFCVPGAGKCSEVIKGGRGNAGGENAANHPGTCPVPPGYQPNCYWPYCDLNGQCAGDIYHGSPYPNYKPTYRPGYTCPIPADRNPQCWFPRCIQGNCGGDPWNMGEPCTPMPSEVDKVHDAQCVYYICGPAGAELGKCVPRLRPSNQTWPCKDNDKCTWDWCDSNGQCAEHEHKKCSTGDMCLKSWCDPATGECVPPVRNGDACCPDGKIDPFEDCEPGINGADAQCCIKCLSDDTAPCTDGNECTADRCVNGKCTSTLIPNRPCAAQNKSDVCSLVVCVADEDDIGRCERRPDPSKEGKACGSQAPQCNRIVCEDGECVMRIDPALINKSCTPRNAPPAPECMRYACVEQEDKTGLCQPLADNTLKCSDGDLCTGEKCATDPKTGLGYCQFNITNVKCDEEPPECFGPKICDPKTGKCGAFVPLTNVSCTPMNSNETAECFDWSCVKGECVRNCPCGNGILDPGEECDYAIPHQEGCCTLNCTGCWCGNGQLDPGEECDYMMPNQTECCNSTCQGCYCGDGILQEDEECDPGIPEQTKCCNATCQGCHKKRKGVPVIVGPAVAAGVAVLALAAAAAFVKLGSAAASASTAAVDSSAAVSGNNPLFQPMLGNENPLYGGM